MAKRLARKHRNGPGDALTVGRGIVWRKRFIPVHHQPLKRQSVSIQAMLVSKKVKYRRWETSHQNRLYVGLQVYQNLIACSAVVELPVRSS